MGEGLFARVGGVTSPENWWLTDMNLSFWGNLGLVLERITFLKLRCCTGKWRNGLEEYFPFRDGKDSPFCEVVTFRECMFRSRMMLQFI